MAYHVEVSSNKGNIVNLDIITKDIKELNYKAIDFNQLSWFSGMT